MPQTRGISRREFLRATAISAIAAPAIVPAAVLGGEGKVPPSERIGVGFIGVGKMANDYHLPSLLGMGDVQCLAVCDPDTRRREHARRRVEGAYSKAVSYVGCAAYVDFRDLLSRRDIDAVCIATPDHWHAIPIIAACVAGKDIYCEKPLTLTIREAQLSIEAVRKHGRVFQTGSQQRSNVFGNFREAAEFIRSGRIGKVKRVKVGVGGPSRPCDLPGETPEPGLEWSLWLGQAPMRPYSSVLSPRGVHNHFPAWRSYSEYSGGGLTDMGAHHYDICQWALGADGSGPVEVIPPEDPKANAGATLIYEGGIEVVHGGPGGCLFEGEKGTLRIDRGILRGDPESIVKEPLREDEVHLERSPGHHRNWIDCIRSRRVPICDVEVGARSATVCHLVNIAYWHRRRLRWDPKAWKFAGDDEANGWLDRARRDPWQLPAF